MAYGGSLCVALPGINTTGLQFDHVGNCLAGGDGTVITAWPDASANANNLGTFGGSPVKKTNIVGGNAVARTNGDDSAVFSSSIAITGNFTYVAVVNFSSLAGQETLICGPSGSLQVRTNSSKLNILKSAVADIGSASTTLSTSTWYTLGVTYDGTNAAFYLNGSADGTATNAQTFTANVTKVWVNVTNSGELMVGDLAEQLLWNAVLSGGDLTTVFTALRTRYGHY